ncbi:MAG: substrate-binding domain-containing protein [Spirochaeta sp.]|nr:substrate-binding domain-containing protein [Spirochaeta sp.]
MTRKQIVTAGGVVLVVAILTVFGPRIRTFLEPHGDEKVIVVMKTIGPHMEFWQIVRAGIQEAATEYNIEPTIVGPRWERDIDRQIEIFSKVIDQSPDAILLAASDYNRLAPLAERAAEAGIMIVTLDSALNSDVPVSFVATDNVEAGKKAGREIVRLVPPDRPVAIVSHIRGVATAIDRERGVQDALAASGRPEELILGTFYSENDPDRAYEYVRALTAAYPELGGIVALNENSTVGVGRALRDLGLADRIHLVGFDNSREEIEFLEKGIVTALVVQKPFNMGYVGIKTVVEALRGQKVDAVIYTESVLVRKEEIFTEENQKLLFPLVDSQP